MLVPNHLWYDVLTRSMSYSFFSSWSWIEKKQQQQGDRDDAKEITAFWKYIFHKNSLSQTQFCIGFRPTSPLVVDSQLFWTWIPQTDQAMMSVPIVQLDDVWCCEERQGEITYHHGYLGVDAETCIVLCLSQHVSVFAPGQSMYHKRSRLGMKHDTYQLWRHR